MKKMYIFLLTLVMPAMLFAQDPSESIDYINNLTRDYDPYQRVFSLDETTGKLKWVTKDGSVTCEADLLYIDVTVEPNGSNFYVKFASNDESELIDCSSGGPVKSTAITVNSESVAHEIADEVNYLCDQALFGGMFDDSGDNKTTDHQTPGCVSGDCNNGYGVENYDDGCRYEGFFKNGLREGQGTYTWKEGDKFVGQWVAGDYTGYGTYYYSDGSQKTGYWNKNVYAGSSPSGNTVSSGNQSVGCVSGDCNNGYGVRNYDGGGRYEGFFKNGLREGQGTFTWKEGDKFVGQWVAGDYTGYGTYYYSDGTQKTGYWNKNVYAGPSPSGNTVSSGNQSVGCQSGDCNNGYGVRTYDGGGRYAGNFKSGLRDGEGTFTWEEGDKYVGHWVAGDYSGYGIYYYSNGTQKTGYWNKNVYIGSTPDTSLTGCLSGDCKEGFGIRVYEGGGRYEGNFTGGLRNGQGTYYWKEGEKYTGEWTNGLLTGMGTYYYANGTSKYGYWENSEYKGASRPGHF